MGRSSLDAAAGGENAGLFADVLATVHIVHGELLGEPSAQLRANLAGSDVPVVFTPYRPTTLDEDPRGGIR